MSTVISPVGTSVKYNSKALPRFIYHITSKKNYNEIMKSGVLKMSEDFITDGIFTIELSNFFKRWNILTPNYETMQEALINHVSQHILDRDIVILRIPTSKLNSEKLKIRSQNDLSSWIQDCFDEFEDKTITLIDAEYRKYIREGSKGKAPKQRDIAIKLIKETETQKNANMLLANIPANEAKHYKQHKHALEYVYKEDIPADRFEKIGEANIQDVKNSPEYDSSKPVKSVFKALLKGTPEVKGAELLKS